MHFYEDLLTVSKIIVIQEVCWPNVADATMTLY